MPSVLLEMEKTRSLYNGLGNYCHDLGQALIAQHDPGLELIYYLPSQQKQLFQNKVQTQICHKWQRYWPRFSPSADLWHLTHQDSEYLPPNNNIPLLLTIHDLNFLHANKPQQRIDARLKRLRKLIHRASMLTTISEFSKHEIEKHLQPGIPIEVIYNGVNVNTNLLSSPSFMDSQQKFLLALAEISPRKNFKVLIDLLVKLPDYHLVIAGRQNAYAESIKQHADKLGVSKRLIIPGTVSTAEKNWLYKNCSAFLFPSLAEGFGLPVIEAMRFGKPVFLSDKTALPEIGGKLAYYFKDFSTEHMLQVFQAGIRDYQSSANKAAALIEWSQSFNWQHAAKQYLKLYHKLT
ncbi:MAG: glycosyltransferase family 4 protein [Gammaproteobacteria bacterium]|nr:glycosyltransferase family 4 protein [Gammaproteobacteria bacterium]